MEAINDDDLFLKMIQNLHGDHYDDGYAWAFKQFRLALKAQADPDAPSLQFFDSPKLLTLLFGYLHLMPPKRTIGESPARHSFISREVNVQEYAELEDPTVTGAYTSAIDVVLRRALKLSESVESSK